MKKLLVAIVAGLMSVAFSAAYAGAADDSKKSDTGATKSEKGMSKSSAAKDKSKKGEKAKN